MWGGSQQVRSSPSWASDSAAGKCPRQPRRHETQGAEPPAESKQRRAADTGLGAGGRGVKAREQNELPAPPPAASRLWKYDLK